MKMRATNFAVVTFAVVSVLLLMNFSFEPPNGSTGAPGNLLCSGCHVYAGGNQGGYMEIAGIPASILPSTTYPVEIRLIKTYGNAEFAGFEVIALAGNLFNSPSAGAWSNFGPNVSTSAAGFGRTYLKHFDGELEFDSGTGLDTVTYTADWTSPATNTSNIWFYGAGNISSQIGTDGDSIVTDVISNVILPVDLVEFQAMLRPDNDVFLQWITASERHSEAFEVMRSRNGIDYKEIGRVEAFGESQEITAYAFVDTEAYRTGTAFYKLKMLDLDGMFHYSSIRTIRQKADHSASQQMNIYPNPARPGACLFIDVESSEELAGARIMMTDANGISALLSPQFERDLHAGLNRYVIDIARLPAGMYTATIMAANRPRVAQQVLILPD